MFLYNLRKIIIKIEKKINFSLFFLFPFRILLVFFEFLLLKKNKNLIQVSNYYIDLKYFKDKKINVISGGVGFDISFEKELKKKFKINKIILIDPTDVSSNFMKKQKGFIFENYALSDKKEEKKIFFVENDVNHSLDNLFNSKKFKIIKCITLNNIIKKYSLNKIDILKLDIEGVADKVIIDAFKNKLNPCQICFELERPLNIFKQLDYFKRYFKLIKILKEKGYTLYKCTELKLGLRSEITAVKNDN